jgi:NADH-quinone oxidoreductase subunit C
VSSFEINRDMPTFVVKKFRIVELLKLLYNDDELKFQFLTTLCGIHYPDAEQQLGMVYHLHSFKNNLRIRFKSFTNIEDPVYPSATAVFETANWMEREAYDFFGIQFTGHPNLKRILNVEEMDYFPMRKEYRLEDATREDKDDKMFGR